MITKNLYAYFLLIYIFRCILELSKETSESNLLPKLFYCAIITKLCHKKYYI